MTIKGVERHIVKRDKKIDKLCFLSKNLYNYSNYLLRQCFITNRCLPKEYDITGMLANEKQVDYDLLPAQTSQQVVKLLYKNWLSFFKAVKDYSVNKSKYLGSPKLPKYKHKTAVFS